MNAQELAALMSAMAGVGFIASLGIAGQIIASIGWLVVFYLIYKTNNKQ